MKHIRANHSFTADPNSTAPLLDFERGDEFYVLHPRDGWYYVSSDPDTPFSHSARVGLVPSNYFTILSDDGGEDIYSPSQLDLGYYRPPPLRPSRSPSRRSPPTRPRRSPSRSPPRTDQRCKLMGTANANISGGGLMLSLEENEVVTLCEVLPGRGMVRGINIQGQKGLVRWSQISVWDHETGVPIEDIHQAANHGKETPSSRLNQPTTQRIKDPHPTPRGPPPRPIRPSTAEAPPKFHESSSKPSHEVVPGLARSKSNPRPLASPITIDTQSPLQRSKSIPKSATFLRSIPGYLVDPTDNMTVKRDPKLMDLNFIATCVPTNPHQGLIRELTLLSSRRIGPAKYEFQLEMIDLKGQKFQFTRTDIEFYALLDTLDQTLPPKAVFPPLPPPLTPQSESNYKRVMCLPAVIAQREREFAAFCKALVTVQYMDGGDQPIAQFLEVRR